MSMDPLTEAEPPGSEELQEPNSSKKVSPGPGPGAGPGPSSGAGSGGMEERSRSFLIF